MTSGVRRRFAFETAPVFEEEVRELPRQYYGLLTVQQHQHHWHTFKEFLHCYVNNHDVTARCFEAHDREGYVLVYYKTEPEFRKLQEVAGHAAYWHIGSQQLRITGDVRIEPGEVLNG